MLAKANIVRKWLLYGVGFGKHGNLPKLTGLSPAVSEVVPGVSEMLE